MVHSSPFLRCVQTSIGVSAGIAQDPTPIQSPRSNRHRKASDSILSERERPHPDAAIVDPEKQDSKPLRLHDTLKPVLRLDAFLGEWQNPEYYALITPPPESVMMLATAKAELLRHEDHHASPFPPYLGHLHSTSHGQLWGGQPRSPLIVSQGQPQGLENLSPLADSLSRSSSMSSQYGRPIIPTISANASGYVPPQPHYAISSNAPIPTGYVAHARDACVDIDYQWDSMRYPLEWGDGGMFPEEWPDMRERFRRGLQHLVDWYSSTDNATDMIARRAKHRQIRVGNDGECAIDDDESDDDDETEAVIVIVTHGGGCNALIGALTEKPILENFRVTSLTYAVLRPDHELSTVEVSSKRTTSTSKDRMHRDGSTGTIPIPRYYDIKLVGDTEHLQRSNSTSSQSSIPSRSPSTTTKPAPNRGRFTGSPMGPTLGTFTYNDMNGSRSSSANPAVRTELRLSNNSSNPNTSAPATVTSTTPRPTWSYPKGGITVGSGVTSFGTRNPSSGLSRTPSIGLWSPVPRDDDEDPMMLLNFSHERVDPPPPAVEQAAPAALKTAESSVADFAYSNGASRAKDTTVVSAVVFSDDETDGFGPPPPGNGLWGGTPTKTPTQDEPVRDLTASKRRWTVNKMET